MMRMSNWIFASFCLLAVSLWAQPTNVLLPTTSRKPIATPAQSLAWDSMIKEYEAKHGETNILFTFNVTNISSGEVVINGTQTTCGCTVAKLPSQPWKLAPGDTGSIQINVSIVGKTGVLTKGVTVLSSVGAPMLLVKVLIPPPLQMSEEERARNAMISKADAQAIFKGSCAACHVTPAQGRFGGDLYTMMCGVCHESPRRASMVPNLHSLLKPTNFEYWKTNIMYGVTNSLMPGFAISQGGPLSEEQVNSLADFLDKAVSRTRATKTLSPEAIQIPPPRARALSPAAHPAGPVPAIPEAPSPVVPVPTAPPSPHAGN